MTFFCPQTFSDSSSLCFILHLYPQPLQPFSSELLCSVLSSVSQHFQESPLLFPSIITALSILWSSPLLNLVDLHTISDPEWFLSSKSTSYWVKGKRPLYQHLLYLLLRKAANAWAGFSPNKPNEWMKCSEARCFQNKMGVFSSHNCSAFFCFPAQFFLWSVGYINLQPQSTWNASTGSAQHISERWLTVFLFLCSCCLQKGIIFKLIYLPWAFFFSLNQWTSAC